MTVGNIGSSHEYRSSRSLFLHSQVTCSFVVLKIKRRNVVSDEWNGRKTTNCQTRKTSAGKRIQRASRRQLRGRRLLAVANRRRRRAAAAVGAARRKIAPSPPPNSRGTTMTRGRTTTHGESSPRWFIRFSHALVLWFWYPALCSFYGYVIVLSTLLSALHKMHIFEITLVMIDSRFDAQLSNNNH